MIHFEQAVVVEGKYDKIRLSSLIDAVIIVTNGFGIYKNKELQSLIRFYAENQGIIVLTDSDAAGFKIRGMIKSIAAKGKIYNAYIPEILGKEKRKDKPSKEGLIGVEGMEREIILKALENAGVMGTEIQKGEKITYEDFYLDGLSGSSDSSHARKKIIEHLSLPKLLTAKALLEVLNSLMTKDEYKELVEKLDIKKG